MIIFILTEIASIIIEAALIGIAFFSLRQKYNWNISYKLCMVSLAGIFVISDCWTLPALYSLDATVTINNQDITTLFNIGKDYPIINLFSPGKLDIIIWLLQSLIAATIGNKMFPKQYNA